MRLVFRTRPAETSCGPDDTPERLTGQELTVNGVVGTITWSEMAEDGTIRAQVDVPGDDVQAFVVGNVEGEIGRRVADP